MSSNFKASQSITGDVDGTGMRIAVVCGRFNDLITNRMLEGTLGGLGVHGVKEDDVTVAWVPGAFEIPVAAKQCASSGAFDAVICLGAVIRGDTAHFEYVAGPCAEGIQLAALETGVPVSFGVLTVDTREQAEERIDRAADAVRTALEMADVFSQLRAQAAGGLH